MNRTIILGSLIVALAILAHATLNPHPRYQLVPRGDSQSRMVRLDVRTGEVTGCRVAPVFMSQEDTFLPSCRKN